MEQAIILSNVHALSKQRNAVLLLCGFLLISNLFLSLMLFGKDKEIILVPGISSEYRISGSKVSSAYLEEMSYMFLSALLDLTPENVSYKRELVLKYTTTGSIRDINEYFAKALEQHQRFKFATYFAMKTLEVNPDKMEVIACGILSSRFGNTGNEEKEVKYLLKYQMAGGILRLKSFNLIDNRNNDGNNHTNNHTNNQ